MPAPTNATPAAAENRAALAVPAVGDIAGASLDLVGADLVTTTADPIVGLADEVIERVPLTDSLLGSSPITSITQPITGRVDGLLADTTNQLSELVTEVTDTVSDDVVDPILIGGPIDIGGPVDIVGPIHVGAPTGVAEPASAPQNASELAASASAVVRGTTSFADQHALRGDAAAGATAGFTALESRVTEPTSPIAPATPAAPSAPTLAGSSAGASAAGTAPAATVENHIDFRLTAARLAFADDDSTPFSLSSDPGSSPD